METRERVEAAAAELGYRPSRAGRALVTGLSDIIVVAVPNVTFGRNLQDTVDRIANATASRGMSVVVRYAGDDEESTLSAVLDLRPALVVDLGVFLTAETRAIIASGGTRILPDLSVLDDITENPNHLIGRLQASHLLAAGCKLVVAHLADDRPDYFGGDRERGVIDECSDAGAPAPVSIAVPLDRTGATASLATVIDAKSGSSPRDLLLQRRCRDRDTRRRTGTRAGRSGPARRRRSRPYGHRPAGRAGADEHLDRHARNPHRLASRCRRLRRSRRDRLRPRTSANT